MYKALDQGKVTMIAANATDGPLLAHDWTVLKDDKKAFADYQACIMVRQDILAGEPQLGPALNELSGKFNNDVMRKLNADGGRGSPGGRGGGRAVPVGSRVEIRLPLPEVKVTSRFLYGINQKFSFLRQPRGRFVRLYRQSS